MRWTLPRPAAGPKPPAGSGMDDSSDRSSAHSSSTTLGFILPHRCLAATRGASVITSSSLNAQSLYADSEKTIPSSPQNGNRSKECSAGRCHSARARARVRLLRLALRPARRLPRARGRRGRATPLGERLARESRPSRKQKVSAKAQVSIALTGSRSSCFVRIPKSPSKSISRRIISTVILYSTSSAAPYRFILRQPEVRSAARCVAAVARIPFNHSAATVAMK